MYAVILLLTTIVCCISLSPGLQDAMKNVPFCKNANSDDPKSGFQQALDYVGVGGSTDSFQVDCKNGVGYLAVYRFCFIVTLFFMLFSVMMVRVRSSNDPRAGVQNGFWAIKFILI